MSPILSNKIHKLAVAGAWLGFTSRQIWKACLAPLASCCDSNKTPRLNQAMSHAGSSDMALLNAANADLESPEREYSSPIINCASTCSCSSKSDWSSVVCTLLSIRLKPVGLIHFNKTSFLMPM